MHQLNMNKNTRDVCNLTYLTEIMSGKKTLIKEIMDRFLIQIPEELASLKDAIALEKFESIQSYAHTMKSSVSIMGITSLTPILKLMEDLAKLGLDIQKISELNKQLTVICNKAISEIKEESQSYL
jgi:HPt (histidine-containing phosphotransfer) domain-containing protein